MNQLTLQWTEAGRVKTQTISDRLPQKIGRDPSQCDIVFSDLYPENHSISRLHVEIFFKPKWERFYLRNLQPKNPPVINGGKLVEGEVALTQGSTIYLGQVKLEVAAISQTATDPTTPNVTVLVPSNSPRNVATPPIPPLSETKPTPTPPPPIPPPPPPPRQNPAYALECPNCTLILPLEKRNTNCTRCGHFLADAESILIPGQS